MHSCPECSKQYSSACALQAHLEVHLCTPAAQFLCYYCPKILRGPIARYNHVSSVHKEYFNDYKTRYSEDPDDAEMRKKVKEYYAEIAGDTSSPNLSLVTADTTVESLDDSTQASSAINTSTFECEASAMTDNTPSDTPNRAPRPSKVSQKLACPSPDCGKDDFRTKHGLKQHMRFRHRDIFEGNSPIGFTESSLENLGLTPIPTTPEPAEEDQTEQEAPQTARSERKRKRQARNDDYTAAHPRRSRRRKKDNSVLTTETLTLIQPLSDADSPLTYTCVCGMCYLDEVDLMIHLQTYHTETLDRECPICFFVLRSSNEYAFYVHKRAHNFDASHPFGCNHPEDCQKKFKTTEELARHTHDVPVSELQGLILDTPEQNDPQGSEQQNMNSTNTLEGIQLLETEEEPYEPLAHHSVQVMFEDHSGPEPSWTTAQATHKAEVELPISTEQTQSMETDEVDLEYQDQHAVVPDTALNSSEITSDFPETEAVENSTLQADEEMYDPNRVIKRSPSIIWLDTISFAKCGNCLLPMEQANHQECPSTVQPPLPIADEWKLWIRG